jgi:hypothetical protein
MGRSWKRTIVRMGRKQIVRRVLRVILVYRIVIYSHIIIKII